MKAGLVALSALFVAGTTIAQPHRAQRNHPHHPRHDKRALVTVVDYVTINNPEILVYVDADGNPVSTVTQYTDGTPYTPAPEAASPSTPVAEVPVVTPTPEPTPAVSSSAEGVYVPPASSSPVEPEPASSSAVEYVAPSSSAEVVPTSTAEPAPSSSAPAPSASAPASSGGSFPLGISYSPYLIGSCKDADAVLSDFKAMNGYDVIRLYGVDCNQITTGLAAAKATNKKLILGIYYLDQVASEVETIVKAVNGDWSLISLITVGNEDINRGTAVSTVVSAVHTARSLLTAAGYSGPISTVDTFDKIIANPILCEISDIATANCHAFFTPSISAAEAGKYVLEQAEAIKKACGGKETLITETGWPKQGDTNGVAVPSVANQAAAIASLREAFGNTHVILFSAFDDPWKSDNAGTFNAEKYWGILD